MTNGQRVQLEKLVHDYFEGLFAPTEPDNIQPYNRDHIIDETKSVVWNRNMVYEHNELYRMKKMDLLYCKEHRMQTAKDNLIQFIKCCGFTQNCAEVLFYYATESDTAKMYTPEHEWLCADVIDRMVTEFLECGKSC